MAVEIQELKTKKGTERNLFGLVLICIQGL